MKQPVKVGDVFVNSWGYDQTNVDAYQVVKATAKTVWLKPIATEPVPGSSGMMCCQVKPVKDKFIDNWWVQHYGNDGMMKKRVSYPEWKKGQPHVSFPHGSCSLWVGESFYNSWYA